MSIHTHLPMNAAIFTCYINAWPFFHSMLVGSTSFCKPCKSERHIQRAHGRSGTKSNLSQIFHKRSIWQPHLPGFKSRARNYHLQAGELFQQIKNLAITWPTQKLMVTRTKTLPLDHKACIYWIRITVPQEYHISYQKFTLAFFSKHDQVYYMYN